LFWFKSPSHDYDVDTGMPVFLFELSHGVFYGFPQIASRGVKVAEHSGGRLTDPNAVDQTLDADEQSRVEKFLSSHLPGVSHEVIEHATCLYTMSPDEHFIVDQHPAEQRVSFVAGLSGHGFKFTPLLGRILADIALDGGTTLPTEFLSVNRFQGG
jgi:glycine/D-amino acid oxidase-like deaminating enzyme